LFSFFEFIDINPVFSKSFNSSLKSGLVNIFPSNKKIIIQHLRRRLKNGNISLRLPEADIKQPFIIDIR